MPLTDPFSPARPGQPGPAQYAPAGGNPGGPAPSADRPDRPKGPPWFVSLIASAAVALIVTAGVTIGLPRLAGLGAQATSAVEVRPTNDVLISVKDLARLEVTELRVEKVVDLSDKQQRLFGYVDAEDTMLLVASGTAVIGIDLEKMDSSYDEKTETARLTLPPIQTLSSRLDPDSTYVYRRETGILAKRNEQLEGRARKEAVLAIERAAEDPEVIARAKKQAERQLTALLMSAGAKKVDIRWK